MKKKGKKKFLLLGVLVLLIVGFLIVSNLSNKKEVVSQDLVLTDSSTETGVNNSAEVVIADVLNLQKVAQHKTKSDCWVVYKNKVYNLTGFLISGGHKDVSYLCGTDMTQEYDNKIGDGKHTESKLNKFFVGDLK